MSLPTFSTGGACNETYYFNYPPNRFTIHPTTWHHAAHSFVFHIPYLIFRPFYYPSQLQSEKSI